MNMEAEQVTKKLYKAIEQVTDNILQQACYKSIAMRIEGNKTGFYGLGYGESTMLKHVISKESGVKFDIVRHAIDRFDEAMGWSANRKKQEIHDKFVYGEFDKEHNELWFVMEYGELFYKFIMNESKGHKHHFRPIPTPEEQKDELEYFSYYRDGKNSNPPTPSQRCMKCGNWCYQNENGEWRDLYDN